MEKFIPNSSSLISEMHTIVREYMSNNPDFADDCELLHDCINNIETIIDLKCGNKTAEALTICWVINNGCRITFDVKGVIDSIARGGEIFSEIYMISITPVGTFYIQRIA